MSKSKPVFQDTISMLLQYNILIRKERSQEAQLAIKEILKQNLGILEVIGAIQNIDEKMPLKQEFHDEEGPLEIHIDSTPKNKKIKAVPFFSFFFNNRKKLMYWAKDTSIFQPGFMGFHYKLSREAEALAKEFLQKILNHILPSVQKIVEKGWNILKPQQYNTFYWLHQFCKHFVRNFIIEQKDLKKNLVFVESFITSYLTLIQSPQYKNLLIEGIYIFFNNKINKEMKDLVEFIESLLDVSKKFSFFQFTLLSYSLYYKKIFTVKDLKKYKEVKPIQELEYIISKKVKYIIQKHIQRLKSKQDTNEEKLYLLTFIKDDQPSWFTDYVKNAIAQNLSPETAEQDLLKVAELGLFCFRKKFHAFLARELELKQENEVIKKAVFSQVWDSFMIQVEHFLEQILRFRKDNKYISLDFSVYEQFQNNPRLVPSKKAEEVCGLLSRILAEFYKFFDGISGILYRDYYLTNQSDKQAAIYKMETKLTPIVDLNFERFIPFANYQMKEYGNKTVMEMMQEIASFTGTLLYICGYAKIKYRLKDRSLLVEESKRNIENILNFQNF